MTTNKFTDWSCTLVSLAALTTACGYAPAGNVSESQEAITGGMPEPFSRFPAVGRVGTVCTGTLIAPSWVLTAKHCGAISTFSTLEFTGFVSHAVDYSVAWYPTETGGKTTNHDIQLLHLAQSIQYIRPLSIYTGSLPAVGQTCTAVGFGLDSNGVSGFKRSASVIIDTVGSFTGNLFEQAFGTFTGIDSGIRTHAGTGLADHGDSGGPLLCGDRIAGVASLFPNGDTSHLWYNALTSNPPASSGWVTHVVADDVSEPSVSAITGGPNSMDLFIRGADGQVWHKWSTGSSWGPSQFGWEPLGGYLTGTPEAVTWGRDRIDVFVRGGDSNPASDSFTSTSLFDLIWTPQGWSWHSLGGNFIGHPAAVAWPQRVAAFGVDPGGIGRFRWWNGSAWLSGSLPTDDGINTVTLRGPIKAINVNNIVSVYALGLNQNLYVTTVAFDDDDGVAPTWENLGCCVVGSPSIVFQGKDAVDVVVRGTDSGVWHKWKSAGTVGWQGYEQLFGSVFAAPVASSYAAGKMTILAPAEGTKGLQYKAWFGVSWVPSLTTWNTLGGLPINSPTLLHFPGTGTIDAFPTGNDFTPSMMQYTTNGPPNSFGWSGIASLGGTLSPW